MPTNNEQYYDYEFDTSFDFEAAPDPPVVSATFEWSEHFWNKRYFNMVFTRQVRDAFMDRCGFFPVFAAPELLDEKQFRKFCYYAESLNMVIDDFPPNYLPFAYRNDPQEWEAKLRMRKNQFEKAIYELYGLKDSSEDEDSDDDGEEKKPAPKEVKKPASNDDSNLDKKAAATHVKRPAASLPTMDCNNELKRVKRATSSSGKRAMNLLDLDVDVKSKIGVFLNPVEWWYLRQTCRGAREWPKPKPDIDYDFIFFGIFDERTDIWQGVAHTLNNVREAIQTLHERKGHVLWKTTTKLNFYFHFIKFDWDKHSIVPLLTYDGERFQPKRAYNRIAVDANGHRYFGVKSVLPMAPFYDDDSFGLWFRNGNVSIGYGFGTFLLWCNGLEPKTRMNLEHIGRTRPFVGATIFEYGKWSVWYSPSWFGDEENDIFLSGPDNDGTKSWIIFR